MRQYNQNSIATADREAELIRLRTLTGAVRLNPGELITDVQRYVAVQEARTKHPGRTGQLAQDKLTQLYKLTQKL